MPFITAGILCISGVLVIVVVAVVAVLSLALVVVGLVTEVQVLVGFYRLSSQPLSTPA
jgi:hypothetical protein